MKMKGILLWLCMFTSIFIFNQANIYAEGLTTGKCGKNVTYLFDSSTGTLTISGVGEMYNTGYGDEDEPVSPFRYNGDIKTVIIEEGVTSIGREAFFGCNSLTNIVIPSSVINVGAGAIENTAYYNNQQNWENNVIYVSNCLVEAKKTLVSGKYTVKADTKVIADNAFFCCEKVTDIIIPDSVVTIGNSAFNYCYGLKNVNAGDGLTSIGENAFGECDKLTTVSIGEGLETIGSGAFESCIKLETIALGNPNKLKTIGGWAFSDCKKLQSIIAGNSLISIGDSAFYGCSNLKTFSSGNLDNLISIGASAFSDCSNLETFTSGNLKNIVDIGQYAFFECRKLQTIKCGENLTNIGDYAFWHCDYFEEFKIGKKVTYIGKRALSTGYIISVSKNDYSDKELERILDRNIIGGMKICVHKDNNYAISHFNKLDYKKYILYPKIAGPDVKVKSKKGKINIRVSKIGNAKKYFIEVKKGKFKRVFGTKKVKYTIKCLKNGLAKGKTYKIKVRAKLKNAQYTKYSKVKKIKIK